MLEFVSLKSLKSEPTAPKQLRKKIPKSIKNRWKSNPGSLCILFAGPVEPWIAKIMTRSLKNRQKWWPEVSKICPQEEKLQQQVFKSCQFCKSCLSCSPTVGQSQRGPAAEGVALKICLGGWNWASGVKIKTRGLKSRVAHFCPTPVPKPEILSLVPGPTPVSG